jgi:tRNA-specific 2-thiouridylase
MSRAVGIFSGGLDSMLAVEVLRRQGVEVLALTFESPFFGSERAKESARLLGVPHRVMDLTGDEIEIVVSPRFGFGRNMNPCMDCHALMFRKAGELLDQEGYDFLFSGEVLGQRPFSQNRQALETVAKASGRAHLILRPLSALLLPPSGPEQRGLVDRGRLLGLKGRSRKPQMALARQWGITHYPSPAGGCLLTDPMFSRRLSDLLKNEPFWSQRDLRLLSVGRHLRISPRRKIVVGRNRIDNERLEALAHEEDVLLTALGDPGPLVLVPYGGPPELLEEAASVCLRYGDAPAGHAHPVLLRQGRRQWVIEAKACEPDRAAQWII